LNWQLYKSGVIKSLTCGKTLDHGVLLVGYDTSQNYFVKNSWGTSWGLSGYLYLEQGSNTCGICNSASYPVV